MTQTCNCTITLVCGEAIHEMTCDLFTHLSIAPPKNAPKSRVIFENQHYTACAMRDGSLVVTHKRKQGGKRLTGPQAVEWTDAIANALYASEANDLCRVFLQ